MQILSFDKDMLRAYLPYASFSLSDKVHAIKSNMAQISYNTTSFD